MTRKIRPPDTLSPRAREIVAAARTLLEEDGPDELTLRRLAGRLGIRAPSLYNHFPDKASLEDVLVASGLFELALTLEAAVREVADPVATLAEAYRTYARRRPHLYRLMTDHPLVRERLPHGLGDRAFAPFVVACGGDAARGLALQGFVQGMVALELTDGERPPGLIDSAWEVGIASHRPQG